MKADPDKVLARLIKLEDRVAKLEKGSRAATVDEWVAAVVSEAPPLTEEQKSKLAILLRPTHDRMAEVRRQAAEQAKNGSG